MKAYIKGLIKLSLLLFVVVIACPINIAGALDNLLLTGVVRSIDTVTGTIWIDVTSEGCTGLRGFKVHEEARVDLDTSLIGKRLNFLIDSSTCERGRVYYIPFERQQ